MIKKDYILIANCINTALRKFGEKYVDENIDFIELLTNEFCISLKEDNPDFNSSEFIDSVDKEWDEI